MSEEWTVTKVFKASELEHGFFVGLNIGASLEQLSNGEATQEEFSEWTNKVLEIQFDDESVRTRLRRLLLDYINAGKSQLEEERDE